MQKYEQATGKFFDHDGNLIGTGWAGQNNANGNGKNNPDMQCVKMTGPLPRGIYTIGNPYHNTHTGPFTLNLIPNPDNDMCGRGDFRIHGSSASDPEHSSEGCIIQRRPVREQINRNANDITHPSDAHLLEVF